MKHIETKKGLQTLKERYLKSGLSTIDKDGTDWIQVIEGCIEEDLAMDETDYSNTSKDLRKLWKGLK